MLAALSTEHKIGMLVAAGLFITFALVSSFLFPRYWPQYPGARGLSAFIAVSVALFVAMLLAVEFFAVEEEEAEGAEPAAAVEPATTTEPATTAEEEAPAETGGGDVGPQTLTISGTEFAFGVPAIEIAPGPTVFKLENRGTIGHDLAIEGPGVEDAKTPVIEPGETAEVEVELKPGTYQLYCTVPGHRDAGMEASIPVS